MLARPASPGRTYHESIITFDGIPGAQPEVAYVRLAQFGPGWHYSRKSTDPNAPESLAIPLPPKVGRIWTDAQGPLAMEMRIAAVEDVTAAGRTYQRCLKITGSTSGADRIATVSYWAPRTGMVKLSMEGDGFRMDVKLRRE